MIRKHWVLCFRWLLLCIGAFCVCVLFYIPTSNAATNGVSAKHTKLTAAVIYQISRFVSWPDGGFKNPDDALLICVFGKDRSGLLSQLSHFTSRKSQGRSIKIHSFESKRDLLQQQTLADRCNILFSMNGEWNRLSEKEIHRLRKTTLLIGNTRDFLRGGGMLALILVKSKINIVVNPEAIASSNVKLESRLRALAKTL